MAAAGIARPERDALNAWLVQHGQDVDPDMVVIVFDPPTAHVTVNDDPGQPFAYDTLPDLVLDTELPASTPSLAARLAAAEARIGELEMALSTVTEQVTTNAALVADLAVTLDNAEQGKLTTP